MKEEEFALEIHAEISSNEILFVPQVKMTPSFDASVVSSEDNSSSNSTDDVATPVMKEDKDSRDELDLYQEEIDWLNFTFTFISREDWLELIAKAVDSYDNEILYYKFL